MMPDPFTDEHVLALLLARLERISADSRLAHRASGVRGALLDIQQALEEGRPVDALYAEKQIQAGMVFLTKAGLETMQKRSPNQ